MLYIAGIWYFTCSSVFNFDDVQSLEGAFTNPLWMVFNTRIVLNCCLECYVQRPAQLSYLREGKKASNLGFIFRPQTRNIQYFEEGLVRSFVSTFGKKFAFFCTETLPVKKFKTDIKCITWGVVNLCMLDGKADGCSQWFLSRLV